MQLNSILKLKINSGGVNPYLVKTPGYFLVFLREGIRPVVKRRGQGGCPCPQDRLSSNPPIPSKTCSSIAESAVRVNEIPISFNHGRPHVHRSRKHQGH